MVCFVTESIKCTLMYERDALSSFQHKQEAGGQQELLIPSIFFLFLYLREIKPNTYCKVTNFTPSLYSSVSCHW